MSEFMSNFAQSWPYWLVSAVLVYAAYIDGKQLKVPNWITFPAVGLATLLPAYSIGGMGAGDVKLMAGIGAWVHCSITFYAFCVSAVVGAVLAVAMIVISRQSQKHWNQFFYIANEIMTVRNPEALATIAAERKSSMRLLPYGIPIAIGTILYFAWMGLLV